MSDWDLLKHIKKQKKQRLTEEQSEGVGRRQGVEGVRMPGR